MIGRSEEFSDDTLRSADSILVIECNNLVPVFRRAGDIASITAMCEPAVEIHSRSIFAQLETAEDKSILGHRLDQLGCLSVEGRRYFGIN